MSLHGTTPPLHLNSTLLPDSRWVLLQNLFFDKVSGQYFLDLCFLFRMGGDGGAGAQQPRRPSAQIWMRCCVGCSSFFRGPPPSTVLKQETHRPPVMAQGKEKKKVRETEFSSWAALFFSPGQRPMGQPGEAAYNLRVSERCFPPLTGQRGNL